MPNKRVGALMSSKPLMASKLTCKTLLDLAKDEWEAFKTYNRLPEPYRSFAVDELKHFSHIAIQIKEQCPQYADEIDRMLKETE